MRELPTQQLNPKIKSVWRINDAIWLVICYAICMLPFVIVAGVDEGGAWVSIVMTAITVVFIALAILCIVVLPPIRYARWRYQLSENYLDIARGIIWRKRFVIPFIRVQNTDTRQGPILRAFHLASVTVSTAAGAHEIPGIDDQEADALRDRAAELARLAKEDV